MSGCDILNEAALLLSSSQMASIFKTPCLLPELHNAAIHTLQRNAGKAQRSGKGQRPTAQFIGKETLLNVPHRDGIQASQASREKSAPVNF